MNRFVAGTAEHVRAKVTADVVLESQTVSISIDKGATWKPAVWMETLFYEEKSGGVIKHIRRCRTSTAVTFTTPTRGEILVKVADLSETPIMEAGDYIVVPA